MAISKERLKELIEQGATIYKKRDNMVTDYQLCSYNYLSEDNDLIYENVMNNYWKSWIGKLDDLFETKEEAEWYLEFGNITRTEMLTLPTWEEIEKLKSGKPYKVYFNDKQFFFASRLIIEVGKYDTYGEQIEQYFCEGTTKENYLEACRIAKKLFLGEEV